jgi:hypothetical protein
VDYPRSNRPYALIVNASLGDEKKPGGLGAILTQVNPDGQHCVIAYANRKLQNMNATITHFCWKCKLPFGAWIISPHIFEEENLRSSPTTDL